MDQALLSHTYVTLEGGAHSLREQWPGVHEFAAIGGFRQRRDEFERGDRLLQHRQHMAALEVHHLVHRGVV